MMFSALASDLPTTVAGRSFTDTPGFVEPLDLVRSIVAGITASASLKQRGNQCAASAQGAETLR